MPFFRADATNSAALARHIAPGSVDIVLVDVPYGRGAVWQFESDDAAGMEPPANRVLATLLPLLTGRSVIAIATSKAERPAHPSYRRLEQHTIGHRRLTLFGLEYQR